MDLRDRFLDDRGDGFSSASSIGTLVDASERRFLAERFATTLANPARISTAIPKTTDSHRSVVAEDVDA